MLGNSGRFEDWEEVDTASERSEQTASVTPAERQKAALHEENQRLMQQVAALQDTTSASSDAHNDGTVDAQAELEAIDREILELKKNLGMIHINETASDVNNAPQAKAAAQKLKEVKKRVVSVQKGLDICFLVDCTGSMVKSKVRSIIDEICLTHKDAIINVVRLLWVIETTTLRDIQMGKFEVHDFVGEDGMKGLQTFFSGIEAISNCDGCEDVAGGLLHVLDLSWKSSTRMVIHFCDCPCHGSKYHTFTDGDLFPTGDPRGNTLEDLVGQLCSRRINYYFAAITKYTDTMARIMQDCYGNNHNAEFKIMEWKDADTSFAPLILNSVSSSLMRSAAFNRMLDSTQSKLSNTTKGKSVFHATVG